MASGERDIDQSRRMGKNLRTLLQVHEIRPAYGKMVRLGCDSNYVGSISAMLKTSVFPAKAGIHREFALASGLWIPAFAGKTEGVINVHPNLESYPFDRTI